MKQIVILSIVFMSLKGFSQQTLQLTPKPVSLSIPEGDKKYSIQKQTVIVVASAQEQKEAAFLSAYFKTPFGVALTISKGAMKKGNIALQIKPIENKTKGAYELDILPTQIELRANEQEGLFYGIQTLIQLIEQTNPTAQIRAEKKIQIPSLHIQDYPRFNYRGMHLDVSRHFYSARFIKKYIDYLAAYKFNAFHWHLTDDQGWRIEIKKYPKLTQIGGFRNGTIIGNYPGTGNDSLPYGGFYTQREIKEIVRYATERHITIIPEIEMPGHASAAIAAYPQLSCFPEEDTEVPSSCDWNGSRKGKQVQQTWGVFDDVFAPTAYTFHFLENVLDEVLALFPSQYIHIGGDECPKKNWQRSAFCQDLIKQNNLKDEHGLQSYFINKIEKYLNTKGRNIIGWDEILEGGLAPNATVMSWRGEAGGIEAAQQNHTVIMSPNKPVYFDHRQSKHEDSITIGGYNSLEAVYHYEPIPKELSPEKSKYILGAQANVWTEYMKNESKVEYQVFPRMIALSEVLWSAKESRNWSDFTQRLPYLLKTLDEKKINYSNAYYDLEEAVLPRPDFNGVNFLLKGKFYKDSFLGQGANMFTAGFWSNKNPKDSLLTQITENGEYVWFLLKNDKGNNQILANVKKQKFFFNKATGKKITLNTEAGNIYPGDGAFTLVNGVQNERGLAKSIEFLGFQDNNLDATIDFEKPTAISIVKIHTLNKPDSRVYLPTAVSLQCLDNANMNNTGIPTEQFAFKVNTETTVQTFNLPTTKTCRALRVIVNGFGTIQPGNSGAGKKAHLLVDEIEVE